MLYHYGLDIGLSYIVGKMCMGLDRRWQSTAETRPHNDYSRSYENLGTSPSF